jgi:lysophospholipase L1-like esterase
VSPLVASLLTIVCLGDSITGSCPGTDYFEHYIKYPDLLQFVLETHLGVGQVKVVNRGFAGNTSTQALARVDTEVVSLKPDIVIVLIGGNDYGNHADPRRAATTLRQNLLTIVNKVKKAGAKVLLLQYAEPKADNMEQVWRHLNAGNPVIAQAAREENVPTLELAPAFREAAQTHPQADLSSAIDGVHLNPYGEVVVARAIFFKLQQLGWIPKT